MALYNKGIDITKTSTAHGENGASAYQIAVEQGFIGTKAEWLASLKGANGQNGQDGQRGPQGVEGKKAKLKMGEVQTLEPDEEAQASVIPIPGSDNEYEVNFAIPRGETGSNNLSGLNDVNTTGATDGKVLKYNADTSKWEPGIGGGGGTTPETAVVMFYLLQGTDVYEVYMEGGVLKTRLHEGPTPPELFTKGFFDLNIIPDTYNTGCRGSLVPVMEKELWTEEPEGNGNFAVGKIQLDAVKEIDSETGVATCTFKDIDFGNHGVYLSGTLTKLNLNAGDIIRFENCKFDGSAVDGGGKQTYNLHVAVTLDSAINIECDHCTFLNGKAAAHPAEGHMTFTNCYASGFDGDCYKAGTYVKHINCYANEAGFGAGAHADGVQYSAGSTFYIDGYRCNGIAIDGRNVYNAAVFIDYETGDALTSTGTAKNCYINGGGYTFCLGTENGYTFTDLTVENIQIGPSCHYHEANVSDDCKALIDMDEIKSADNVWVTSAWKSGNKIKFLVTNYTNEEHTIKVKTSANHQQSFTIPKCPTWSEYYDDPDYTIDDFPFDLEFEVTDGEYFVAYDDNDVQIRFVDFTEDHRHTQNPEPPTKQLTEILAIKSKVDYVVDDVLNVDDLVVTAYYSDSTHSVVTTYTTNASSIDMSTAGVKTLTVTYTEDGITKTDDVAITVVEQGQDPTPEVGKYWQLDSTPTKKYFIIGTDDDAGGNAMFYRLARTYDIPYTLNTEGEEYMEGSTPKNIGNDVQEWFTEDYAPSIAPTNITIKQLAQHIIDNGTGEVALHAESNHHIVDSRLLEDATTLSGLYTQYTTGGGTKTEAEFKTALTTAVNDYDLAKGVPLVANGIEAIEDAVDGSSIKTFGIWGGPAKATIDSIEINLDTIGVNTANNNEFKQVAIDSGMFGGGGVLTGYVRGGENPLTNGDFAFNLYRDSTAFNSKDYIPEIIDSRFKLPPGRCTEAFLHVVTQNFSTFDKIDSIFSDLKQAKTDGKAEAITRADYLRMGSFVTNPIRFITLTRNSTLAVGTADSKSAYTLTATLLDGTVVNAEDDWVLVNNTVDNTTVGTYQVYALYRGYTDSSTCTVTTTSVALTSNPNNVIPELATTINVRTHKGYRLASTGSLGAYSDTDANLTYATSDVMECTPGDVYDNLGKAITDIVFYNTTDTLFSKSAKVSNTTCAVGGTFTVPEGAVCMAFGVHGNYNNMEEIRANTIVKKQVTDVFTQGYRDLHVIPDKYNTGLTDASALTTLANNTDIPDTNDSTRTIRFKSNTGSTSTPYGTFNTTSLSALGLTDTDFVFELNNIDFSQSCNNGDFQTTNWAVTTENGNTMTIIFTNCKFKHFAVGGGDLLTGGKLVFNNCTFEPDFDTACKTGWCAAEFNNCKFLGVNGDCLDICDAEVNNCYMIVDSYKAETHDIIHTDGIQFSAANFNTSPKEDYEVTIDNCLVLNPKITNTEVETNSALMLNPSSSKVTSKVTFNVKDVITDGGANENTVSYRNNGTIDYCAFDNVQYGPSYQYHPLYPSDVYPTTDWDEYDYTEVDELLVASVINDGTHINLNVFNLTDSSRVLTVTTNKGTEQFTIDADILYNDQTETTVLDDFPYNVQCQIDATDVEYVVCYDRTSQVRFVDFTPDHRHTA